MLFANESIITILLLIPLNSSPILPEPLLYIPILIGVQSISILDPIFPSPLELPAISKKELSLAVLDIIQVLSDVLPSVRPREDSFSLHFVLLPSARVCPLISPSVSPFALDVIVHKRSSVLSSIDPIELPLPIFDTILEMAYSFRLTLTFVDAAILVSFFAVAMLLSSEPLSFVTDPVFSVVVLSVAVAHAFFPVSLVVVAAGVDLHSFARRQIVLEVAFVTGAVFPNLLSKTLSQAVVILAFVSDARVWIEEWPENWIIL